MMLVRADLTKGIGEPRVTVLQDILEWSQHRPAWQRDALRRLVLSGDLTDEDIRALAEICKSGYGLAEPQETAPLAQEHVPERAAGPPVSLVSIFHHRGVNALAEGQELKFGLGLTIVYGDNGAGKTGYIRILKSACRARGIERILGNVVSGATPLTPIVAIKYTVGAESDPREWAGAGEDDFISRVSVFDTQCAAVYLTEKTDVAFRPFGLDLFDKLVQACKAVRSQLEQEQRSLGGNALIAVQVPIPEGTAVAKLLASVSSLTKPEDVQALAQLSPDEQQRFEFLDKSLLDLQANDPDKLIQQLTVRGGRVQGLALHIRGVETALSDEAVRAVFETRTEGRRKSEEAKRLRDATFPQGLLNGTGSETWTALWEAARSFSHEQAYPDRPFPVINDGAKCVLCQQDLDHASAHRLRQFEDFVTSTVERELRHIRETFKSQRKTFLELKVTMEAVNETIHEIRIEHAAVADTIEAALASNARRHAAVVAALTEDRELAADCPALISVASEAHSLRMQIEERIRALRTSAVHDTRKRMTSEIQELRARKLLARHQQTVVSEIERRKKYAAYGLCIDDTKTQAITTKSTALTRTAVSQKLRKSFQDELVNLSFRDVEVELKELGGAEGIFYHKLVLTRAPGAELPKVVSEGEQRCLSIAAFFAELSTADDPSGIVFDDPVSSLDFQWRNGVARRLVQESKTRQVVVFTHDVVFLLALRQYAEDMHIEPLDQHVRRLSRGAGVCANELPWVALPVKKKIGYLKNCWQTTDKLWRDDHKDAYEREAKHLYGLLREAWERALEEVLLGGVVERYRPSVESQRLAQIADITADDCTTVDAAMTKCSTWLTGHDRAAAARAPVPEPAELQSDIQALETWVDAIRRRRRKS
jgi:energy-coupling factor transporter ATP-binding protein EcfA2